MVVQIDGYDYEVQFKKGIENVTADALSRQPHTTATSWALHGITTDLLAEIQQSWQSDPKVQETIQQLISGDHSRAKHYS